jgi:hypothetical protein
MIVAVSSTKAPTRSRSSMGNDDRGHVALPKLYGAPAYSRPRIAPTRPVERPFDPDELPLASELGPEELALVQQLTAHPYDGAASSGDMPASPERRSTLRGRPFRLHFFGSNRKGGGRDGGAA